MEHSRTYLDRMSTASLRRVTDGMQYVFAIESVTLSDIHTTRLAVGIPYHCPKFILDSLAGRRQYRIGQSTTRHVQVCSH